MQSWFEQSSALEHLRSFFREKGIPAYLVGGYLRDRLLGRESHDLDVAIAQEAIPLAKELAGILGGAFFALDPERDVGRIVLTAENSKYLIDIARLRGKVEDDLARRDFTIDALAQTLIQPESPLIDPYGGQKDLGERLVRTISPQALTEDPLRLLRAVRLAAILGFKIEAGTREGMVAAAPLIATVAVERVRDELAHLLLLPYSAPHLRLLHRTSILNAFLPELPPALELIGHSLGTVEALEISLAAAGPPWVEMAEYLEQEIAGGRSRGVILKTVALLHHTAQDYSEHPPEEAANAKILQDGLTRLAFSTLEVRSGVRILRALPAAWEILEGPDSEPLALYRFFRDAQGVGREALLLALADQASNIPGRMRGAEWPVRQEKAATILKLVSQKPEIISPPPLVDGEELLQELGIQPGPKVGQLLEQIREAQVQGRVGSKEEAIALARSLLPGQG